MKFPRALPPLQSPSFLLATPPLLQYGVLLLGALASLATLVWLVQVQLTTGLTGSHYAAGAIMTLIFAGAAHPRNWRAWVAFAADPRGIYLHTFRGGFVHVPWADVGESAIGTAGIGSNRQRTVILRLRVDEAAWAHLVGGRLRRVGTATDAAGYRAFGIGNACRDVEETRRQIERLRPLAAAS